MVFHPLQVEQITDESSVRMILAKTGFDRQLGAVRPTDTALFGAHATNDSFVLLQHQENITLWRLIGAMPDRVNFKKEIEDKLKGMSKGNINPGDNIEFFDKDMRKDAE